MLVLGCARCPAGSAGQSDSAAAPSSSTLTPLPASRARPTSGAAAGASADLPGSRLQVREGGKRAVRAEHGLVTSVEPHASRAGVQILERGGNAVDAAVAVAFALAVTHPSAGNIGGGGFMLVRPANGRTVAIDFRETAPAAITQRSFDAMIASGASGPAAVGIPGSVAGLCLAHSGYGSLPLAQVLAPAIKLAREGHRVGSREALSIGWNWPMLKRDAAARSIFGRAGRPLRAGSWVVRPDLARVLARIAKHGPGGFYEGPTARALLRVLGSAGMTEQDLRGYRAVKREPLRFHYRGLLVEVMPPPSAGGVALAQILLMLEALAAYREAPGSASELHLLIEASRRAQAVRRFEVPDPDALSPAELTRRRALWIQPSWLLTRQPHINRVQATPSASVHPLYAAAMKELAHTTHFAVVDGAGGIVSCTTTLSAGYGAKLVAPGTGIVLNNSVAAFGTTGDNLPAPGRRSVSSMAPALLLQDGRPVLVLGSPGGDTIPSTIVQVLRNVVDHGMTIDNAVDAPRIHHGFVPDELRYERRRPLPPAVLAALQSRGHRLSRKLIPIGDANSILLGQGAAWGYADPREGGLALAARDPAALPTDATARPSTTAGQ
jgi:gamma-glutamyltranspeptidase/glutathione hydrolase